MQVYGIVYLPGVSDLHQSTAYAIEPKHVLPVKADPLTGRVLGRAIVPGGHGIAMRAEDDELLMDVGASVHIVLTNRAPFR